MKQETKKIIKFGLVGSLSVVLYYSVFILLVWIGVHALTATILTYTATAVVNFALNKSWTFRHSADSWQTAHLTRQIYLTILLHLLALGINMSFVWVGTQYVGAHDLKILYYKVAADLSAAILSFLVNRFIIFKPSTKRIK